MHERGGRDGSLRARAAGLSHGFLGRCLLLLPLAVAAGCRSPQECGFRNQAFHSFSSKWEGSVKVNAVEPASLASIRDIPVAGFSGMRVFYLLMPDAPGNRGPTLEPTFSPKTTVRVWCLHHFEGTPSSAWNYFDTEVSPEEETDELSGWVEIPVIGETMTLFISGRGLPPDAKSVVFYGSIYLY